MENVNFTIIRLDHISDGVASPSTLGFVDELFDLFDVDWKISVVVAISVDSLAGVHHLKFVCIWLFKATSYRIAFGFIEVVILDDQI